MPTIAWFTGNQPTWNEPLATTNSGSLDFEMEVYLVGGFIEGAQYGVVDILIDATPLPGTVEGDLFVEYLSEDNTIRAYFPGIWYFDPKPSGTWNIRLSVDGVLADGELVVTSTQIDVYYVGLSWGWNPTIPDVPLPFWTRLKSAKQLFT